MFTGGLFLKVFSSRKRELVGGQVETRWRMLPAIIMVVPYIIWAGYRGSVGDTGLYRKGFQNAPASLGALVQYVNETNKDKGYAVFTVLLKTVIGNSDVLFFLIIAAFQILCICFIYRKYSLNLWFSFFLFIASADYISWVFNGMRQFIAVTLIFACLPLLLKKKYIPVILCILLAATFHATALLMIPVIFIVQGRAWNKKTLFFIVAVIVAVLFIDQFTTVLQDMLTNTQYENVMTDELWQNDNGTNPLRVALYTLPAVLALVARKYVEQDGEELINLCVNMSVMTAGIYIVSMVTSGIYIGRLPIYTSLYSYILLPWLIEHVFERRSWKLLYSGFIVVYLVFFFYQMHFAWGII